MAEKKDHAHPYNQIRKMVRIDDQKPISTAFCICRVEKGKKGTPAGRLTDACLTFGVVAQYHIDNGIGRELTEQELFDKLDECQNDGLFPLSTNSKKTVNLCMHNKEACQVLRNIKKWEYPALQFHSGYFAGPDQESCIGCGLHITQCPSDPIQVIEKEDMLDIPETFLAMNIAIARERGRILG